MIPESVFDKWVEVININYIIDQVNCAKIELNKDKTDKVKVIELMNKIKEELGYR